VSYFPLLVAGPIERATHLLPQLKKRREFNYATTIDGLRQILWGLFKKIVIADNCASFANLTFSNPQAYGGSSLLIGAVMFSFQIYCDFSGYSDIALGASRLFGIELLTNFSFPYFSQNITQFWQRWHISLTSWFRDYLYIPMGGSRVGVLKKIRNILIVFLVSGLWHGANWTFVCWGLLNALYLIFDVLVRNDKNVDDKKALGQLTFGKLLLMGFTFTQIVFAWIFFRSDNLKGSITYISGMLSKSLFDRPAIISNSNFLITFMFVVMFVLIEWRGRTRAYALETFLTQRPRTVRRLFYYSLILSIYYFAGEEQQFIYFQF
jgi:D-alanyl-lipoteichoic acid acyltransferase DltB (MBOAT superfamily)